jgi:hypothetical protein
MRILFYALLLFGLGMLAAPAFATGKNNHTTTNNTTNNYTTTQHITYPTFNVDERAYSGVSDDDLAEAVAKSAACDHSYYYGTNKLQLSVQGAYFDGESELCVGGAWRPEDSDIMMNFSVSPDEDTDKILYQGGFLVTF